MGEIEACVELQRLVWGFPDIEAVPVAELASISHGGGYLRLAEEGGRPVGFCYGFWTLQESRPVLYSRMVAVLPEHRGRGIATELKLDQREWVLSKGGDRIHWTCDPLVAGNGRLNFGRLGATSGRYIVDLYGSRENEIQRGLPTDRLWVQWNLADPRATARLKGRTRPVTLEELAESAPAWVQAERGRGGPEPASWRPEAPSVRVEVPRDLDGIRHGAPETALGWRMAVREALKEAFERGYRVVDFAAASGGEPAAGAYLLEMQG